MLNIFFSKNKSQNDVEVSSKFLLLNNQYLIIADFLDYLFPERSFTLDGGSVFKLMKTNLRNTFGSSFLRLVNDSTLWPGYLFTSLLLTSTYSKL